MSFSVFSRALTINHSKCGTANSTNFPVYFDSSISASLQSDLKSVANGGVVQSASGYDIVFYSDATLLTVLPFQIDRYNQVTGEYLAHIKIPTVSFTADITIYVGYSDTSIVTSQENVTGTWDANFMGVYHLGNGTSLSVTSATGTNNGTNHSATATTGQLDGAALLVRASLQYISVADDNTLDFSTTPFTVSAWFKKASNAWFGGIVSKVSGGDTAGWSLNLGSDNKPTFYTVVNPTYNNPISSTAITDTNWHHAVGTRNGTNTLLYIDGVQVGSASDNAQNVDNAEIVGFGPYRSGDLTSNFFDGSIDEVRLSNVNRSASWIKTEYNCQSAPSTFWTVGDQIPALIPPLTVDHTQGGPLGEPDCAAHPSLTFVNKALRVLGQPGPSGTIPGSPGSGTGPGGTPGGGTTPEPPPSSPCANDGTHIYRPTIAIEWEDPTTINPVRSRIINGDQSIDGDAPIGSSLTYAECQIDSNTPVAINYASLQISGFPEPNPTCTLVSATVHAIVEYIAGGSVSTPVSDVVVFNQENTELANANNYNGSQGALFSFSGSDSSAPDIAKAEYSITYIASDWMRADHFNGLASNVWVRAGQWQSNGRSYSPTVKLRVYDVWIEYIYA